DHAENGALQAEKEDAPRKIERELCAKNGKRIAGAVEASGRLPDEPGGNRHHEIEKVPDQREDPGGRNEGRLFERRIPVIDAGCRHRATRSGNEKHDSDENEEIKQGSKSAGAFSSLSGRFGGFSVHADFFVCSWFRSVGRYAAIILAAKKRASQQKSRVLAARCGQFEGTHTGGNRIVKHGARRQQAWMPRGGAVIGKEVAVMRCHPATCFMENDVGRRKIPVILPVECQRRIRRQIGRASCRERGEISDAHVPESETHRGEVDG